MVPVSLAICVDQKIRKFTAKIDKKMRHTFLVKCQS